MHPAKSVIFFTTASGAGYGLLIWLALSALLDLLPHDTLFALVAFGIGLALVVAGLLSSTFHLGRPERAWRAMSQWRTSWLSREGVAALTAFVPLGLFALAWIFDLTAENLAVAIGIFGAAMSLLTIYCTAMIYASLRPIPAWHNGWTVAGYLALGPMNGAVILAFLLALFGHGDAARIMSGVAVAMLVIGLIVKLAYWHHIHAAPATSTAGTATGLGHLGRVDLSASPHDTDNYLLREMGFRIARKHAGKLRQLSVAFGFIVPAIAIAAAILLVSGVATPILLLLAWAACQLGVTLERWLFFAEAKHAVTLYYGEQAV